MHKIITKPAWNSLGNLKKLNQEMISSPLTLLSPLSLKCKEGPQITLSSSCLSFRSYLWFLIDSWLLEVFRPHGIGEDGRLNLSSSKGQVQKVWSWRVSNLSLQEASQGSFLLYASPPNWYCNAQAHDDHHEQPTDNPGGNERSSGPKRGKTINIIG